VAFPGLDHVTNVSPVALLTHGGGVAYESECKCWSAGIRARFWPQPDGTMRPIPDVGLQFSLTGPGGEMALIR